MNTHPFSLQGSLLFHIGFNDKFGDVYKVGTYGGFFTLPKIFSSSLTPTEVKNN